ncbi:MAG: GspH/FimT family pseudopilin [Pseudomonadota bacterium]
MSEKQKGFSFIELLVVMAILLIMGAIAVPSVVNALPSYRLERAARDLSMKLRIARSQAIKQNRTMVVRFYPAMGTYTIDGRTVALEQGISFGHGKAKKAAWAGTVLPSDGVSFRSNKLTFSPRGISSNSGYVYLQNDKGRAIAIGATTAGNISYRDLKC